MIATRNCLVEIRCLYPAMHAAEKKIADFILKSPEITVNMTVSKLSKRIDVADSSIVRFCQKLGFNGFTQLKLSIAKNLKKTDELILEDINMTDSSYEVASKVFSSSIQALMDSLKLLDKDEFDRAVDFLINAKKIEFYGVGTSATIAMDAYYRLMRIGLPTYVAIDPHISRISASMLDDSSVAVGISHTGRTKDTCQAIQIAKEKGAKTICITSFIQSPIYDICDVKLVTSTSETRFLREAVSSRIAQIALLDSLYTCVAIKKYDTVVEKTVNMAEILNEMRYK